MPPEHEIVRAWLVKAQHDWLAAQDLFLRDRPLFDVMAFHCQQATEKTLKAFLTQRGIPFTKTHDLAWLLDLGAEQEPALNGLRAALKPLAAYAVVLRYPGPAEPTRAHVEVALRTVAEVWQTVTQFLPAEVVPSPPAIDPA